jgi:hypothetical protein
MIARNQIFWPVIVQMLLTMLVYVRLIKVKVRELKAGKVDLPRRGLHEDAWPDSVLQVNNNIRNQFELPVLFYGVCFILWGLEAVGVVALVLAWLFVVSRSAHTWIHLTSNYIPNRRRLFTVGWWILLAMMLLVVWQLAGRAITAV